MGESVLCINLMCKMSGGVVESGIMSELMSA